MLASSFYSALSPIKMPENVGLLKNY